MTEEAVVPGRDQVIYVNGHPLDGARAKIERALSQIPAFTAAKNSFLFGDESSDLVVGSGFHDESDGSWVLVLTSVEMFPLPIGVTLGEIVHNLRSALDHVVFELAVLNGGGLEPSSNTQFPICETEAEYRKSAKSMLKWLSEEDQRFVEHEQPYKGWTGQGRHPLSVLRDLSNDDKHRVLQPALIHSEWMEFLLPRAGQDCEVRQPAKVRVVPPSGRPLMPGMELLRVPISVTGPDPLLDIKFKAAATAAFRDGTIIEPFLIEAARVVGDIVDRASPALGDRDNPERRPATIYGRFEPARPIPGTRVSAVPYKFDPTET